MTEIEVSNEAYRFVTPRDFLAAPVFEIVKALI